MRYSLCLLLFASCSKFMRIRAKVGRVQHDPWLIIENVDTYVITSSQLWMNVHSIRSYGNLLLPGESDTVFDYGVYGDSGEFEMTMTGTGSCSTPDTLVQVVGQGWLFAHLPVQNEYRITIR